MLNLHPRGSTAYIKQSLRPDSLRAAATPETKPPPPQQTIAMSGVTPSSRTSNAELKCTTYNLSITVVHRCTLQTNYLLK